MLESPALLALSVSIGGITLALLGWVASRIVSRIDLLTERLDEKYTSIRNTLHDHDLRLNSLEIWRKTRE